MKIHNRLFNFKSNELILKQTLKITGGHSTLTLILPERDDNDEGQEDNGN